MWFFRFIFSSIVKLCGVLTLAELIIVLLITKVTFNFWIIVVFVFFGYDSFADV